MPTNLQCFAQRRGITNQDDRVEVIIDVVCDYYDVGHREIMSESRDPRLIWPRHVIMGIAAAHRISSKLIGKAMRRHRGVVSYADKKVRDFCDVNAEARSEVQHLTDKIRSIWISTRL